MEQEIVRYSSAVGEVWVHAMFKVKYCRGIFDNAEVRAECGRLLDEACEKYRIRMRKKSFDANHVHSILDMGIKSKPEIAKLLKGYVAKKLFGKFPWLKKKYFWGSGLWNPSYYIENAGDLGKLERYLDKQKYSDSKQTTLNQYAS